MLYDVKMHWVYLVCCLTFLYTVYKLIYILTTFVKLRETYHDLFTLFWIEQMTSNLLKSPYANTLITFTTWNRGVYN